MQAIQWHCLVRWELSSTLAMMDVFLTMFDHMELFQQVRVINTPVTFSLQEFPHRHRIHAFKDLWRIIDGVAVNVLELENAYLEKGNVSYTRKAVIHYMKSLIRLDG